MEDYAYIGFIIAAVFVMMAVPLLLGKGKWMIAGYNTMSKEQKDKYDNEYDMERICRIMGFMLILNAAALIVMFSIDIVIGAILLTVTIIVPLVILIIGQRSFLKKG